MFKRQDLATVVLALVFSVGCGQSMTSGPSWTCNVSLTLVPSRIGSMSSQSGEGTGTGSSQAEALNAAYDTACAQLNLDGSTLAQCRAGQDFSVEGGSSGNIRLFSAVERSVDCSGSTG